MIFEASIQNERWIHRTLAACACSILFLSAGVQSDAAPMSEGTMKHAVSITDFVGTIEVVESKNKKIEIVSSSQGSSSGHGFKTEEMPNGNLNIRGSISPGSMNCVRQNGELRISLGSGRSLPIAAFPRIVIAAPASTDLDLSVRAGDVNVSEVAALRAVIGGCTSLSARSVPGIFELRTTGGAHVNIGQSGHAEIDATHGGVINLSKVASGIRALLGGTARLTADSISGDIQFVQAGASRATVASANAGSLKVELDGASRIDLSGKATSASFDIRSAARASVTGDFLIEDVRLLRAGRLFVNGEVWRKNGS